MSYIYGAPYIYDISSLRVNALLVVQQARGVRIPGSRSPGANKLCPVSSNVCGSPEPSHLQF